LTTHRHGSADSHHNHEGHAHALPADFGRAFAFGIALNLTFVAVEVLSGLAAHSLSLLADAGHNFGDVMGLALAWAASAMAKRRATPRFTYGLRSSTILASLANAILLLIAVGGIAWEAFGRLRHPVAVEGTLVIWTALAGIAINTMTALAFRRGRKEDLNIRGAYLHMASDALVSLGVVVATFAMIRTGLLWLDPAVSLVISAVILLGTWSLLRETVQLSLHAVPSAVDPLAVRQYLEGLPGVHGVHDLHIWALSTTETALTAHLVLPAKYPGDEYVQSVIHDVERQFGISHSTLQFESVNCSSACTGSIPA